MISERELVKQLEARIELDSNVAPNRAMVAKYVVKSLTPTILRIIRDEVSAALRKPREVQQ